MIAKRSRFHMLACILILSSLVLSACSPAQAPVALPSATSAPSATLPPTETFTPAPTSTPAATATPENTATPLPTATPEPVPGVDIPLEVDGVPVQVVSVTRKSDFSSQDAYTNKIEYKPKVDGDTVLVVEMQVPLDDQATTANKVKKWALFVRTETYDKNPATMVNQIKLTIGSTTTATFTFLFSIKETDQQLTLLLPGDNTIPLKSE